MRDATGLLNVPVSRALIGPGVVRHFLTGRPVVPASWPGWVAGELLSQGAVQ